MYIVSTIPDGTVVSSGDLAVMTLVAQVADGSAPSADDAIAANAGVAIMNDDNGRLGVAGTYNNGATTTVVPAAATDILDDILTVQDVFNEPAGTSDSEGNAGVVRIGQTSDDSSYTVGSAELTVTKVSVALWDPVNLNVNPKSIPGAYVRYTITIANSNAVGTADADLTTLSDTLVAALDLDPDFTDGSAANVATNAAGDGIEITHVDNAVTNYCTGDVADADVDGCSYTGGAGGTLAANVATVMGAADSQLSAGESLTITFNVIVQ